MADGRVPLLPSPSPAPLCSCLIGNRNRSRSSNISTHFLAALFIIAMAQQPVVAQQQQGEVREIEEAGGIIAFPGMDVCDSDAMSVPPDPVIAAGPEFIVHMVNSTITVYDRDHHSCTPAERFDGEDPLTFWAFEVDCERRPLFPRRLQ